MMTNAGKLTHLWAGVGMLVLAAVGCGGEQATPQVMDVVVSFGVDSTTVNLSNVDVRRTDDGKTTMVADMESSLQGTYQFEAVIDSPRVFTATVHNLGDISHEVRLSDTGLDIEFERPTWVRTESLGFMDAALLGEWLDEHASRGVADCGAVPERFADLPLHYATAAMLSRLAAEYNVDVDVGFMHRLMCAQAADFPDGNGLGYPQGIAGWNALARGEYLPPTLALELPPIDAQMAKNTCNMETRTVDMAASFNTVTSGFATTNIGMICNDAIISMDTECCQDEFMDINDVGHLHQVTSAGHPFCGGIHRPAGASRYTGFQFLGHAKVCPGARGTCQENGNIDTVTPYACTLHGYTNLSQYPLDPYIGGVAAEGDGVAAWTYLRFQQDLCFAPGTDSDLVYGHNRSVDMKKTDSLVCDADNVHDCYCGN